MRTFSNKVQRCIYFSRRMLVSSRRCVECYMLQERLCQRESHTDA